MTSRDTIEAFWRRFLFRKGLPPTVRYMDCFHFDLTQRAADELLGLTLAGVKRATCSSLVSFQTEGLRPPKRGDLSIVTDWAGTPRCVIETTGVRILAYRDVDWELARQEGEDTSLEGWRIKHRNFFIAEGKLLGYGFSPDMMIVFEQFRVVDQEPGALPLDPA